MTRKPTLPEPWYSTVAEVAYEFDVHPDRIRYYMDSGLIQPAALMPKAALPVQIPGPARHVCIALPDYRGMGWQAVGDDHVAPLAGEFQAFQVDGQAFSNLLLKGCDGVVVSQSDLVITITEREALECMRAVPQRFNPTERRNMLCMLDLLASAAYPDQSGQPYAVAEHMVRELELAGVSISRETVASKLKEARDALAVEMRDVA
jgi:hypothetical protein